MSNAAGLGFDLRSKVALGVGIFFVGCWGVSYLQVQEMRSAYAAQTNTIPASAIGPMKPAPAQVAPAPAAVPAPAAKPKPATGVSGIAAPDPEAAPSPSNATAAPAVVPVAVPVVAPAQPAPVLAAPVEVKQESGIAAPPPKE